MPFYVYKRVYEKDKSYFKRTGKHFSLAGYNILHRLWQKIGNPINKGWHVTSIDLIKQWSGEKEHYEDIRLIIDYDPKATWRVGLAEPTDIYIFTYGDPKSGEAWWSPMMWRLKRVFYRTFDPEIDQIKKLEIINKIESFDHSGEDIFQFLYIHGDKKGWIFGPAGRTNGALIENDAREYFKKFF